ncbi:unnamed protein product [Gulo gulo]|uniref:Uncharacterized protein n=1 Tax=Gulo gulo TaxID=48420 RepID=A0A9X9LYL1_GULGU|nr:unnamed protein product [Gulo gulo]
MLCPHSGRWRQSHCPALGGFISPQNWGSQALQRPSFKAAFSPNHCPPTDSYLCRLVYPQDST